MFTFEHGPCSRSTIPSRIQVGAGIPEAPAHMAARRCTTAPAGARGAAWVALGDAVARLRAPPPRAVLCLLVIALLVTPEAARGARIAPPMRRARRANAAPPPAAAGATGGYPGPGTAPRLWQRLSLRGGGDIHNAEVDLGHGNKVVVRAWTDGGAVTTSLTASCDGFEVQWGVALGQMDSWSHARTAQGGKYAALVPPGSRDHLGTAVRTPLAAGAPLVFDSRSCGQPGDELWGLRFIIVEVRAPLPLLPNPRCPICAPHAPAPGTPRPSTGLTCARRRPVCLCRRPLASCTRRAA